MICDKCGKNTTGTKEKCSHCGAQMPEITGGSGFYDILSIKEEPAGNVPAGQNPTTEGYSDRDMQKLLRKTDNITKYSQKNTLFSLIAIVLSVLILLTSIINNHNMNKKLEAYEEKLNTIESKAGVVNNVEKGDSVTVLDFKDIGSKMKQLVANSQQKSAEIHQAPTPTPAPQTPSTPPTRE